VQAREEARHVHAFARYVSLRWGRPHAATPALTGLLDDMVRAQHVPTQVVGMQLVFEGMAMGLLSTLHRRTPDPLLQQLTQLVMVDEALHHRVGKTWIEHDLATTEPAVRNALEDWVLRCFRVLIENLNHPREKAELYADFGLDPSWVAGALREAFGTRERQQQVRDAHRVFHPLVSSLLQARLITQRTRHFYAVWFDLAALETEADLGSVGSAVLGGIARLEAINMA
jgi:hypothetical protein